MYQMIWFVPSVDEVDANWQIDRLPAVAPRRRHVFVASICDAGSNMLNDGLSPAPVCETVNVWPAMVTVAVRFAPAAAATFSTTVPVPVPVLPARIVMNVDEVVAVHAQAVPVVTVMLEAPPMGPTAAVVADSAKVQVVAGVLVVGVVVVVVVVLGVAGTASLEQPAAPRATARSPRRERSFMDEVTLHNIAGPAQRVKATGTSRALLDRGRTP